MADEACVTCRFFQESVTQKMEDADDSGLAVAHGGCRRFPPVLFLTPQDSDEVHAWDQPLAKPTGWCGEYQQLAVRPADESAYAMGEGLLAAATETGGYNRTQLELLGVPWPPPKGWKGSVLGKIFPAPVLIKFILARDKLSPPPGHSPV